MRIAVSGSHGTGKTTLIAAFLDHCPAYAHEPEAFETLGDDIEIGDSGEPTPEALKALLDYTVAVLEGRAPGACVVFERSPVDYLAYAAASGSRAGHDGFREFLSAQVPIVRAALAHLDVIAYVPVAAQGPVRRRPGENGRFRRRVDECLRRALLDDAYDLFGESRGPSVVELPPDPAGQLAGLLRLVGMK